MAAAELQRIVVNEGDLQVEQTTVTIEAAAG
jgi:hypothetical protein